MRLDDNVLILLVSFKVSWFRERTCTSYATRSTVDQEAACGSTEVRNSSPGLMP